MNRIAQWTIRIATAAVVGILGYLWFHPLTNPREGELVSVLIAGVTTVYALISFEILRQNRTMARAAIESTGIMERSLRLSYEPRLEFYTLLTKDPSLSRISGCRPLRTQEYDTAFAQSVGSGPQTEFVFAVFRNLGPGIATHLSITGTYQIKDTANPNQTYSVTRGGSVQYLEAGRGVGLFISITRVPTSDDLVQLVEARSISTDFYREAQGEPPKTQSYETVGHIVERGEGCVLSVR